MLHDRRRRCSAKTAPHTTNEEENPLCRDVRSWAAAPAIPSDVSMILKCSRKLAPKPVWLSTKPMIPCNEPSFVLKSRLKARSSVARARRAEFGAVQQPHPQRTKSNTGCIHAGFGR